jgi:hypothetical protein
MLVFCTILLRNHKHTERGKSYAYLAPMCALENCQWWEDPYFVGAAVIRHSRSWSHFLTDGQSISMSRCQAHSGTCDLILLTVRRILSGSCSLVSVGRPLWREEGSAVCSAITQWSKSRRTRSYTLLSHLRLPQPRGPGSHIYIPQEQGGPVISLGTGFPLCHLLQLAGPQWRYSNPPPTWRTSSPYILQGQDGPLQCQSHVMTTASQSVCLGA